MRRLRKSKREMQAMVLLLIFSVLMSGLFANRMVSKAAAKGRNAAAVKTVLLKIGKEKVTKTTFKMKQGEKRKLKVSISPKKGKKTIRFTSSNKKVVTVNKSGSITAKKAGSAKINVTVRAGKKGAAASVKKTTWVKIEVVKAAATEQPADQSPSVTSTPDEPTQTPDGKTPTPDEPTRTPDGKTPTPDEPTRTPDEATPTSSVTPIPDAITSPTVTSEPVVTPQPGDSKSLIVYFSCTDTTKKIAEYVQEITGADIYRIEAQDPYTAEDLNYGDSSTRATKEQNDPSARPAIAGKVENMAAYQSVVIAYPIWWGQAPRIISTFLESYDFSGKTIIPICTSHSSGMGSSATNLHSLVDDSVTWLDGRRFSATTSKEEIIKWLEDSGIRYPHCSCG